MIVLDTNVLSELMREAASPAVIAWARSQVSSSIFTTCITEAEILYGLALLPGGKRRAGLELAAAQAFVDFDGRGLPFDSDAARA